MKRPLIFAAATVTLVLVQAVPTLAQSDAPLARKLEMDRLGDIEPGTYLAGDKLRFSLDPLNGNFLLRFDGVPEIFVLYADNGSLGGRILKYDSGETAMRVAGWGGITLYTDSQPGGLPAVRVGDSVPPSLPDLSLGDVQNAAGDESEHLAYVRNTHVTFEADWDELAASGSLRALLFDTLENTARGIERFAANPQASQVFGSHVDVVRIEQGSRPTIQLSGKTIIVTFNASRGYPGRASSRAIARALRGLFPAQKQN